MSKGNKRQRKEVKYKEEEKGESYWLFFNCVMIICCL